MGVGARVLAGEGSMSEYLNPAELRQLTGYAIGSKQAEWLKAKAIPHRQDGARVIASREHVRAWIEGRHTVSSSGPNWAALKAA